MEIKCTNLKPLSVYVAELDDWELVEYVSRYEVTNKWSKNGATEAKIKTVLNEWEKRYPGEEVPIIECVPPLDILTVVPDDFECHE